MTTAGNLSIEICYQKLKVNSNYCFWHSNFQNQVYTFFCIISWVVLYSSVIARFAGFLLRISCHSNVSEKFDFCFTEFRKATACLCMTHTAPTLTLTLSYMRKYTWKKDIGQRKVHNPVKQCTFYQYQQRFSYSPTSSQDIHEMLSYEYGLQVKYITLYFT